MSKDPCLYCLVRGNLSECDTARCAVTDSWKVQELRKELAEARKSLGAVAYEALRLTDQLAAVTQERDQARQEAKDWKAKLAVERFRVQALVDKNFVLATRNTDCETALRLERQEVERLVRQQHAGWWCSGWWRAIDMNGGRAAVGYARAVRRYNKEGGGK